MRAKPSFTSISALTKEIPERSLAPSTVWEYNEKSETWMSALTQPCWHPVLGLPDFRTVKNKILFIVIYPVYGIFIVGKMY